ncbi:MAG: DUF1826 domain-containing protein [Cyclobacteriaceae bacterium]
MSLLASIPFLKSRSVIPRQVFSSSWVDRMQILDEDVNLFCWKRPVKTAIISYLETLSSKSLSPITFTSHIDDLPEKLSQARKLWDQDHSSRADVFWIDAYRLIHDFMVLVETESATIHLKKVVDNQCAKFHTDGYSLRLFTTYSGAGTQWLPERATNRNAFGKTNELIVNDVSQIQQMRQFEVGILKGGLPNERQPSKGIVHKSPEINHKGEKRIILRVDI